MASSLNGTGVTFSDGSSQSTAAATAVNVQTFLSTGTWTKPTGGQTMARIQIWGGGAASWIANGNGGAGGGYNEITVPLSYINSQTVTVGAGGATAGAAGGTSSVTLATAVNGRTSITATGGSWPYGGPCVGYTPTPGAPSGVAADTFWSGGYASGNAIWGGAGGAYSNSGATGTKTSVYGGNGGAILSGTTGAAGTQPGGGGSCGSSSGDKAGAAGQIIITCY